ncbi:MULTISPECIES: efflux RND transporter periplasmic adaptor subunit [Prevotellaceae]|uniref:efflux RND transporter periplasmic adaptor subunit n=1 Tax=Leyella stercorea TaxID=363265 RepID=UPI001F34B1E1|nr:MULTISPECIES: efflux RND transporter periplasmic adaptor subunit [Prevotellaceae]MCF2644252.1 efflux RND transporter periplasmic adaptor subunit [Leyella stercorea]MCI6128872.1 efflux RND transporter periplasmic adaptor subunit [Prevotella sp.]MCI7371991.1 efflux RND transporter periplasmic adaptor subunit [Prevotella sp.]MDY3968764.1 efflux RND transporter periplasmic adaptor subunit [Prevotella sp.]MDY4643814.1 efflux RND transporter periplasmic adaptor subunit [Prevotella sp.]
MKKLSKVWLVVAVVIIVAIVAWALSGSKKEEQISFETAAVAPANIMNSITATGTIEPVTSVTVGTQVSGIVSKLYVDYNSVVKKGQVIAELDKTNLMSQLNSAKTQLATAQSQLNYQTTNFNRYKTLYQKGLVAADDFDSAKLSYTQAKEQVAAAKEEVQRAQTNLGYATITSPIDGIVLSKSVEEGQTVAASFSTPELFTIAQDLTNMQVVADVDEADIGDVKEGERVSFTVDAYPDDTFEGTVKQVRQEATTTNNVVTYEVVISAPNADLKLKPGLTANVTIYTAERKGVLSVQSKALRFTPQKETVGKMKIVDQTGNAKNKVWTIEGNSIVAHNVNIGMTDGTNTQILNGISAGVKVVTGLNVTGGEQDDAQPNASSERSPFAPGPRGKKK